MINKDIKLIKKMTKEITRISIKSRPSAKLTLLGIPVGESRLIKTSDIKPGVIRTTVGVLNKEGYSFIASEKGLINEVLVTRIK